ncbi:MAG: MBL fold metallo-hydrolase [Gemmataceae bacterium]
MTLRFTVLASGSRGNATLIQAGGFGVLIDAGLPATELGERLRQVGQSWNSVHALLLSHTHSDHWNDRSLDVLVRRQVPLYCHPDHHRILGRGSGAFAQLQTLGLVRSYSAGDRLELATGVSAVPLPVRHDSGETFGFRLDGPGDLFGRSASIGYVADLGCWDADLADALVDVDLLAVEFNHDVDLERGSRRPAFLVARVLGDEGHLSNDQAAELLGAVLARSAPGRLQHVVQLHLSEHCNRPELARQAARRALAQQEHQVLVYTASQHTPGKPVVLEPDARPRPRRLGSLRSQ